MARAEPAPSFTPVEFYQMADNRACSQLGEFGRPYSNKWLLCSWSKTTKWILWIPARIPLVLME